LPKPPHIEDFPDVLCTIDRGGSKVYRQYLKGASNDFYVTPAIAGMTYS
jgi:hypothetical protein